MSWCQKKVSSGLHGSRKDNKRQKHPQSGWASLHPDQSAIHLHQPPHFLCRMPFLTQPFQFIRAWDRHRNMLDCISPWLGSGSGSTGKQLLKRSWCTSIHNRLLIHILQPDSTLKTFFVENTAHSDCCVWRIYDKYSYLLPLLTYSTYIPQNHGSSGQGSEMPVAAQTDDPQCRTVPCHRVTSEA